MYADSGDGLQVEVGERTRRRITGPEGCLHLRKDGEGTDGVLWTDVPATEDCELFCVWQTEDRSATANRLDLLARASEEEGVGVVGGSSESALARIAQFDPDHAELDRNDDDTITVNTTIAQRLRVVDDEAWVRVWPWGDREPRGWAVGPVSVDVALAGGVGLFTRGSSEAATDLAVWVIGADLTTESESWAPQRDPNLDFASFPEEITFPLAADRRDIWYPDGWDEDRDGGDRVHRGVDIYEEWGDDGTVQSLPRDEEEEGYPVAGAKVYAVRGGTIRDWMQGHPDSHSITPGSGGGYTIHVDSHDDAYMYGYLHLGPDEPDRHEDAFAPHPDEDRTLGPGDTVERGQHIGWLGNSGVTGSGPHLHFEIRDNDGSLSDDQPSDFDEVGAAAGPRYDPYPVLRDAERREDYPSDE